MIAMPRVEVSTYYHDCHNLSCCCYNLVLTVEDTEHNNGHDKPYFMSKKLMKLLNAKNVKTDGTDGTGGAVQMESLETVMQCLTR